MRAFALLLAAGVSLSACTMNNEGDMGPVPRVAPPAAMTGDPSNPMTAAGYVPMAASSDRLEIQSSQLALQASTNQAVRSFANMMIAHHQSTSAALASAAASAGLPPPPMALLPMHQQMLDQLRSAGTGQAFDNAYKAMQIQSHQAALQLHQGYASGGDVPALRQAAASAVPIVQQHLTAAQNLNVMGAMMSPGMPMNGQPAPATAPVRSGERG